MENIISNSSFDDDDSKEETILAQVLIGMIQNYTKTRGDELANSLKLYFQNGNQLKNNQI